jgi:VWFA-related protein
MSSKKFIQYFLFVTLFAGLYNYNLGFREIFSQQEKQEIPRPAYEVEVTVTNIDVVVTDKQGKRITDLKPENFEIFEEGMRQRLTNFYEVKGMEIYAPSSEKRAVEPTLPPQSLSAKSPEFTNKIIFYFDNWQLNPLNRNRSIEKIETFIQNNFTQEGHYNEGMIVTLGQKLEILQEFTANAGYLLDSLKRVKKRSGQTLIQMREREDLRKELNRMISELGSENRIESFQGAMGFARNFVEAENNNLIYSLKSLSAFIENVTGIEGKKILIYVSDGLPINPGEEVFDYIDSAYAGSNARSESLLYDATRFFKELTARCNAQEISLYPINAQGLESGILSADREAGWNLSRGGSGMVRATSHRKNDALRLMANDTGGIPIMNMNDIGPGLEMIRNDLQFYYSLGYVSPHREEGKFLSIEVKLVGIEEKHEVRVRQSYLRISQEDRIRDSVSSRLFLQRWSNPMNLKVQALPTEPLPNSKKLSLKLKIFIPIKNLTLYSQDNEYIGKIKIYITLKDSQNRVSPCHELVEDVKIPAKDYEVALKSSYPYIAEMFVDPDHYIFSLALKDVFGDLTNYLQFEKTIE